MGLFDKKECSICGAKIGLLGNKKLYDLILIILNLILVKFIGFITKNMI